MLYPLLMFLALLTLSGRAAFAQSNSADLLTSSTTKTFNGQVFHFCYRMQTVASGTSVSLRITDAAGRDALFDEFQMSAMDLKELLTQEGVDKPTWCRRFLFGNLTYGAKFSIGPIKPKELNDEILTVFTEERDLDKAVVLKSIRGNTRNIKINFRATWREDMQEVVYIPALHCFVLYGHGQY